MYKAFGKRIFDLVVVIFLLPFFTVLAVIVSVMILITMGRPILFIQARIGRNEKTFNIYKFRTMKNFNASKHNVPSSQRITRLGGFLRKTSLDEIPQLINILKRDMSLVGPRPLLPNYLPLYKDFQRKRHNAYPGITGLSQISGRSRLSWSETFDLDIEYVESISLIQDVVIIFKTIFLVLMAKDTTAIEKPIKERFNGKN